MTYDSLRQRIVLLGNTQPPGTSPGAGVAEHWEYDGTNWIAQPALPAAIGNRLLYVTVFDEVRAETLLLDSSDARSRLGDVWAWDGANWSQRPGFGDQPWARFGAGVTADPGGATLLAFGGANANLGATTPTDELWSYDGTTWTLASTGTVPARWYPAMWSQPNGTFVFGGAGSPAGYQDDTWRWNGTGWSQVTSPTSPSPRQGAAVAYNPTTNQVVLFCGQAPGNVSLADTWTFDGAVWQQVPTSTQPAARWAHAMGYDPVRDRVVLLGGAVVLLPGGPTTSDTWEWDGSSWQQILTTASPPLNTSGTMTYDASLQRMVFAATGGQPLDGLPFWSYDGSAWTVLPVDGTLGGASTIVAFEPHVLTGLNGRLAVVGGYGVREVLSAPARVETYGSACGVTAPVLAAESLPQPGNATFALELTEAPANAPVATIGADTSASLPVLGCTLLVDPGGVLALLLASPSGFGSLPLPLPATPGLIGSDFFFQSAALSAAVPSGLAFSAGLRVRIGE